MSPFLFLLFSCSVTSNSFVTPWTVAHQASLSMGFSSQEYWNRFPFPSPGDFPNPGIKLTSPALAGSFFTTESPERWHSHNSSSTSRNSILLTIPRNSTMCLILVSNPLLYNSSHQPYLYKVTFLWCMHPKTVLLDFKKLLVFFQDL